MKKRTRKRGQALETRQQMPNLPCDNVFDILSRLPAKSIGRFRCVCKHWYHLLKRPDFIKSRRKHRIETEKLNCFSIKEGDAHEFRMHITKSSSVFEDDQCSYVKMDSPFYDKSLKIDIEGSSNGLILLRSCKDDWIERHWLWNPYTEVLKQIIIPKVKPGGADHHIIYEGNVSSVSYGVSYNCDTNDYKIVQATCYNCDGCKIQVYTSESNSWKTLPDLFPYRITSLYGKAEVIFVCEAFHWIGRRLQSSKTCVVAFDIRGEKLIEIAAGPTVYKDNQLTLGRLGGRLCILSRVHHSSNYEVWVMKDYNVIGSWTKLFVVHIPYNNIGFVKLLWDFKNGEVLFVTTGRSCDRDCCLVLYDPVSQKCKVTKIQHNALVNWNVEAYAER